MSERVLQIGKKVFIRTVTSYFTGRVVHLDDEVVTLETVAWIAYTGRFATALKEGKLDEIEPYPGRVDVMRGSMVDVSEWPHELPTQQK